jgi:tRNA nucleotidyltransferase/poly(A) polymerase
MENINNMSIDEEEKHSVTTKIKVTEHERQIFDTLLEVVKLNNLTTTIRVNGGWVRDKMLDLD